MSVRRRLIKERLERAAQLDQGAADFLNGLAEAERALAEIIQSEMVHEPCEHCGGDGGFDEPTAWTPTWFTCRSCSGRGWHWAGPQRVDEYDAANLMPAGYIDQLINDMRSWPVAEESQMPEPDQAF